MLVYSKTAQAWQLSNLDQLDKLAMIGANAFSGCTSFKKVAFMGGEILHSVKCFHKSKGGKFLFGDQSLFDVLKNHSGAEIVETKCSLITLELFDGAVVSTVLVASYFVFSSSTIVF